MVTLLILSSKNAEKLSLISVCLTEDWLIKTRYRQAVSNQHFLLSTMSASPVQQQISLKATLQNVSKLQAQISVKNISVRDRCDWQQAQRTQLRFSMMNSTSSALSGDSPSRRSNTASHSFVYKRLLETVVAGMDRRRLATSTMSGYLR